MKARVLRVLYSIIESLIRNISGGFGQRIRYQYYSRRLRACGTNVRIDEGVIIQNPESIEIGSNVWLLPYSILTGRGSDPIPSSRLVRISKTTATPVGTVPTQCLLKIGDQTSIGTYNIIHGYGGLSIGRKVTTSARVSIYSFSHAPNDPENPYVVTYANSMVTDGPVACIVSPVILEDGVWLGLGTSVFGGTIGENTFVAAHSLVKNDLASNSYASGIPAKRLRERFVGHG
jgi:acetyltransferase-like isoleucine patch superfamily enzyme